MEKGKGRSKEGGREGESKKEEELGIKSSRDERYKKRMKEARIRVRKKKERKRNKQVNRKRTCFKRNCERGMEKGRGRRKEGGGRRN